MLSRHNILNNGHRVGQLIGHTEQDRVCLPVPFYYCSEWYWVQVKSAP